MGTYDIRDIQQREREKRRVTRDGMGEYIIPPGGKPLTSLGVSTPGPSEYLPKIDSTKYTAPHYSLSGPYKHEQVAYSAGPGDYDVAEDIKWSQRLVHLKGKGKTRPYSTKDKKPVNELVGPGKYSIDETKNSLVWDRGPKWTLKSRHKEGVHAGHPNQHINPVDTYRHPVPPSNIYRPNSKYTRSEFKGHGPEYSLGPGYREVPPRGPGPADHDVRFDTSGEPGKTFGLKPLKRKNKDIFPSPADYNIETTMGKGTSKTIGTLQPVGYPDSVAPPPNMYVIPPVIGGPDAPHTAQINWRPFTPEEKAQPGPTDYNPVDNTLKKSPRYTFRGPTKPVYPDVMHYPNIAVRVSGENPGPGQYNQTTGTMATNKAPSFSLGKRLSARKRSLPAPNQYSPSHAPDAPKAPSFSFGTRHKKYEKDVGPGPAAYLPHVPKSGIAFSMLHRPSKKHDTTVPGPNEYRPLDGQTRRGPRGGTGVTFKGRPSPFVFSGRKGTVLLDAK